MCKCKNIAIGSYDNQASLEIPQTGHTMSHYITNRQKAGLCANGPRICVDNCLKNEILELWSRGIHTTGCCCGHNQQVGYIGVFEEDISKMKDLGYIVRYNSCRPDDEDGFYPMWGTMHASG